MLVSLKSRCLLDVCILLLILLVFLVLLVLLVQCVSPLSHCSSDQVVHLAEVLVCCYILGYVEVLCCNGAYVKKSTMMEK